MKHTTSVASHHFSPVSIFACIALLAPMTRAATVWTGSPLTFTQAAGSDPTQAASQDRITPNVWITRGGIQGIFNAKSETFFSHTFSPADTEWANGTTANYSTLSYTDWNSWAKTVNPGPPSTVGLDAVVHLISEDIYIDIQFTSWGGSSGGFAYQRSTPGVVVSPSPTVSITNPVPGFVFSALANIPIKAAALVNPGTVTNVAFFANGALIESAQSPPFSIIASNFVAGNYALVAIATAAGISATSSVVNISVVTPVAVSLSSPQITNGQFAFDYVANPGLAYVIQNSSNLVNWISIATNIAESNPAHFNISITSPLGFFRVARQESP